MEKTLRIKKLKEIQSNSPEMTGIRLNYKGEKKLFKAYKIDLDYLIYNKYNGRIGSSVKSFEKEKHELDPEDGEDKLIIEHFIWESKKDRNETTMKSLVENGQNRYGIVTSDGVIIDGNRRASLLNRIYKKRDEYQKRNIDVEKCKYFIAIILPDDADKKEILRLETTYQMGEDEKLDYNPIEKYLKCKDLSESGFKVNDVAKMMGEKETRIKEWNEIMGVMDEYLDHVGYSGIYTRLDKKEGQFVDLNRYLKSYNSGKASNVTWKYDELDVSDLTSVCFDYIRADYEGKSFRNIADTGKSGSIFSLNKELWEEFLEKHQKDTNDIEEESIDDLREKNSDADLSRLLKARDEDWIGKIKNNFVNNLKRCTSKLEDLREANKPLELLKKALDTLSVINVESDSFYDEDVKDCLKEINKASYKMMNLIK